MVTYIAVPDFLFHQIDFKNYIVSPMRILAFHPIRGFR